jgi:hypothetical protein
MDKPRSIKIPAKGVRSLAWYGDQLMDWVGGGVCYSLDGESSQPGVYYAYVFDAAATSPSGKYQVIYTRLGTKGLVLRRGEIVREINRSYYFANTYEYPVVLFSGAAGRELIAHCPDDYCRLEIEDLATGARLTSSEQRQPADIFHSRLSTTPSGRYLLSAGWLWHPLDAVNVYDVEAALKDPAHLDGMGVPVRAQADESSATFLDERRLAITQEDERETDDDAGPSASRALRIFDIETGAELATLKPAQKPGTMMAVGAEHLLSLYEHPKLIHLPSNAIVHSWPEIRSGTQVSSILTIKECIPPPIALDPTNRRCAIAVDDYIHVLLFEE